MKLTNAQRKLLAAAAKHKTGRLVGGDPRTRSKLVDLGLVDYVGHHYGPLYDINAKGREAVAVSATTQGAL